MHIFVVAAAVILLIAAAYIICLRQKLKARRRRAAAPKAPTAVKRKVEFSKLILILVMLCYFIAVGLGVHLSMLDFTQYSTLALLVGAPTTAAIGFYCWKAKAENTIKLKKDNPKETQGIPVDLNNINNL